MNIKQQADSIVEKFKWYAGGHGETIEDWEGNETKNATHCAIMYCEGILGELKYIIDQIDNLDAFRKYVNYTELLTELKSRI